MRILQVITRGDEIGGAQTHVIELATQLQRDGHEVAVASGLPGLLADRLRSRSIAHINIPHLVKHLSPIADVSALSEIRGEIRRFQPDLVACHSSKAGILGRVAARLESVPSVFTAHGWSFTEGVSQPQRTIYRVIERFVSRCAAMIICVSEFDRRIALAAGIKAKKLTIIHNGIPDMPCQRNLRGSSDVTKVVMVGRFDEQKDHPTLLRAIANVPGTELHLVGDGPTLGTIQDLASNLGISDRCVFHGYSVDVASILSQSDIFCLISHYEGFPISTLEAMRSGLPTIVSDVGGAAEAVKEGMTGFLVGREDEADLKAGINLLSENEELRNTMGHAARTVFLERFQIAETYQRTLAVYGSLVQKHGVNW